MLSELGENSKRNQKPGYEAGPDRNESHGHKIALNAKEASWKIRYNSWPALGPPDYRPTLRRVRGEDRVSHGRTMTVG